MATVRDMAWNIISTSTGRAKVSRELSDSISQFMEEYVRRSWNKSIPDSATGLVAGYVGRICAELVLRGYHSERLGDYTYIRQTKSVNDVLTDFDTVIIPFLDADDFGVGMANNVDGVGNPCCQ